MRNFIAKWPLLLNEDANTLQSNKKSPKHIVLRDILATNK